MSRSRSTLARVLLAACLVAGLIASASAQSANAADLETVRARAQSVADEVTALERRLDDMRQRREGLDQRIVELSGNIGSLESKIHDIERKLEEARSLYVERAIESYKSGATGMRLEMLLAAESISELIAVAEINSVAVSIDGKRLQELEAARLDIEDAQDALDARKQDQIDARAELEAVGTEILSTLDDRRSLLADLTDEVNELERAARRAVETSPVPTTTIQQTLPAASTAGLPDGYVSTGVHFGGVASWYGPGFAGNSTANGEIFDPMGMTAASKELPFNTLLFVKFNGRGVVVRINDRGPYVGDRIIDLSQGAAQVIGLSGIGWVDATIVLKE
ncbi:MAG: septal ring lytic transglycosylase RlpA family protein [Actinomycetota bacterium]